MDRRDIYDVAERAGVSIATVSRVLNSPERVSPETRARVLAVIDELAFVPRAEAVARARKATGRIGAVAPFFTIPSFADRLHGMATALNDSAYELVVYTVDTAARRDSYLTSLALTQRVDGVVIMALPFDESVAQRLLQNGLQAILVEFGHPAFSSLEIDDVAGGRLAAQHFLAAGHRRCAFVGDSVVPDYAIHTSDRRLGGYRQALAAAGVALPDCYLGLAPHGREPAYHAALALLMLPEPPTAIFAASDTQALGVLKAARARRVRVPDDLAIIGFDDVEMAEYIGLTTIRQHLQESGRMAVEWLMARFADPDRPRQRIELPLELVQRDTA